VGRVGLPFVAFVLLIGLARPLVAGERSCGGGELHLDRSSARREAAAPSLRAWADYLGPRARQARAADLFVPSQATLTLDAQPAPCRLYQAADAEPEAFLLVCEIDTYYVDFARRAVASLGTSLASVQEASDRSASVILHAPGTQLGGVPVGGLCLSSPYWNPWFREREVWWR